MKYLISYNESIKNVLKPKSDNDILNNLKDLSPDEIFKKSVEFNFSNGFKYLIDNNLIDNDTKYIIEKYKFGLHQNEMKDYESWFINQLNDLNVYRSILDKNVLIYKKNDNTLFNYNEKNYTFYYDYNKIYRFFKLKFNLNDDQSNILVKGIIEKQFKIRVDIVIQGIGNMYGK